MTYFAYTIYQFITANSTILIDVLAKICVL